MTCLWQPLSLTGAAQVLNNVRNDFGHKYASALVAAGVESAEQLETLSPRGMENAGVKMCDALAICKAMKVRAAAVLLSTSGCHDVQQVPPVYLRSPPVVSVAGAFASVLPCRRTSLSGLDCWECSGSRMNSCECRWLPTGCECCGCCCECCWCCCECRCCQDRSDKMWMGRSAKTKMTLAPDSTPNPYDLAAHEAKPTVLPCPFAWSHCGGGQMVAAAHAQSGNTPISPRSLSSASISSTDPPVKVFYKCEKGCGFRDCYEVICTHELALRV